MFEFEEIITPLFTTEWSRRIGLTSIVIFSLLLLITLISTPFTWHHDYLSTRNQPALTKRSTQPSANEMMALILKIPDKHLFGASMQTNFPITSLQLQLVGIIQANPVNASRAIISEANQPGKIYKIGDSVAPGVYIKTIMLDSVILENDSHMEKLPLRRGSLLFKNMPKSILGE